MTRVIAVSTGCHASAGPQHSLGTAIAPHDVDEGPTLFSGFLRGPLAYEEYFEPLYREPFRDHLHRLERPVAESGGLQIPRIGGDDDLLRRQIDEREGFIESHLAEKGRPAGECYPARIKELDEVDLRHEIGVDSMASANYYPHSESTWPHSIASA